ncbi:MAG: hypothetical protein ACKOI1_07720, partial [Bacteroidota bacterium]
QHTFPFIPLVGMALVAIITLWLFRPFTTTHKAIFVATLLLPWGLFALNKLSDGTEVVFFGYGRYFLAIPFAWGFILANNEINMPRLGPFR